MAIFKRYDVRTTSWGSKKNHQLALYFSERPNGTEMYGLGVYLEYLFPGIVLEEARKILDNKIGSNIDINLYTFSVLELTNNVYKHFICKMGYQNSIVKQMHVASIMDREEEKQYKIINFTLSALQGNITGVRQDNNNKEVINDPGTVFNLTSFLNYYPATDIERMSSEYFRCGDPDDVLIRKAIVENQKKVIAKYKAKYKLLFE